MTRRMYALIACFVANYVDEFPTVEWLALPLIGPHLRKDIGLQPHHRSHPRCQSVVSVVSVVRLSTAFAAAHSEMAKVCSNFHSGQLETTQKHSKGVRPSIAVNSMNTFNS